MIKNSVKKPVQWPQVQQSDDVRELTTTLEREYPDAAEGFTDTLSRRRWLQLMGASMAFGGMTGCRYKIEKIAPYAFRPSNRIPGVPVDYATCLDFRGVGQPILAKSFDGRPIKLDGNPDHVDSNGASDIFTQARVLDLYDPDRSQLPMRNVDGDRDVATWNEFFDEAVRLVKQAGDGSSFAVLSEINSSPSRARLKKLLLEKLPNAKWVEYNSVSNDNEIAGTKLAFGKSLRPHYAFDAAKVIVSIDGDPLNQHPAAVKNSGLFAKGRDPESKDMSRLYAVESQFSVTGGSADHRLPIAPGKMESFVKDLESNIDEAIELLGDSEPHDHTHVDSSLSHKPKVMAAMVEDLVGARGKGIVVCGFAQPAKVQAAVWRINEKLKNLGTTITFTETENRPSTVESIKSLVETIKSGSISTLLILDGNPAYDAPVDLDFESVLESVANSIHLSYYDDETSHACKWHLNVSHPLEAWGDAISYDGSWCIAQPLILPLYESKSVIEVLAAMIGLEKTDGLDIVRESFAAKTAFANSENIELAWNEAVHLGFVKDSAAKPVTVSNGFTETLQQGDWAADWNGQSLEMLFMPGRQMYDGRFANNGWLQELPDFITKLTWDNAAIVSPRTAKEKGLKQGRLVQLDVDGVKEQFPVHIQPGHANGTVTLALGYGRTRAGRVGGGIGNSPKKVGRNVVGTNAGKLRTTDNWYFASGVKAIGTSTKFKLALTQDPFVMDAIGRKGIRDRLGRNSALIRRGELESFKEFQKEQSQDEGDSDARNKSKQLPIINNVSLETGTRSAVARKSDDEKQSGHDLAHGHWPDHSNLHFENKSLMPNPPLTPYNKWGMGIDLNKCNGCNACVIACQSENNISVVGKDQVVRGREMHWIRIDAYFVESEEDEFGEQAEFAFQPVACHHCENAPCETVCPVAATTHSAEGLNDMVYNRCIGTRYCGNNCPYKVRRFNYLNYSEAITFIKYPNEGKYDVGEKQLLGMHMNPEVTVRSRGVMEKCTYCVQRIQNTKILARNEKRSIGPNEITVACQGACPTKAITFGDLSNKASDVAAAHGNVRSYVMLEQLNNLPRTRYLARVLNPHPALAMGDDHAGGH